MKLLPLLLIVFAGCGYRAIAGETGPRATTQKVDCSNAISTPKMAYCAEKSLEIADKDLNDLYKQQMKRLITAESKAALRESQLAWLAFIRKACVYEFGGAEPNWSSCLETRTKARIEELKSYIACTGGGCPV
jgi:uncharacterized protein YecT (DUF1311 family)